MRVKSSSFTIPQSHPFFTAIYNLYERFGSSPTYWVAYSGGLDSHVLLSICHFIRLELGISVRALHVNHGLSENSAAWALHCRRVCENYQIDYSEKNIQMNLKSGESIEEIARNKRYAIFAELLQKGDILLTAHHQNDQAETLLLQLMRGAGLKGLAAMPAVKRFASGYHARPLLSFSHTDLKDFAHDAELNWIEDESNQHNHLNRNFIRHQVLPTLVSRWPAAYTTLSRSAKHCAEAETLLETFAKEIFNDSKGEDEQTLSVAKLKCLSDDKQRLTLRFWIHLHGYSLPPLKKIETIRQQMLTASWDSLPEVRWSEVMIRRYRDHLYLLKNQSLHDPQQHYEWDGNQSLLLPQIGCLHMHAVKGKGLQTNLLPLSIRFRQGGEVIDVPRRGRHTLKNLFQEWKVLPWERNKIPLIYWGEQLIGIVGYFIATPYTAKVDEDGHDISLESIL